MMAQKLLWTSATIGMAIMLAAQGVSAAEPKLPPAAKGSTEAQKKVSQKSDREDSPKIQIAILLDTSGSMSGLINQARTQLWKMVNDFSSSRLAGKTPSLEVAVYEYGNDNLPAKEGYIRLVVQMSDDLDKVSEGLFALSTNGGSEYCGQVIDVAVRALDWTDNGRDLHCIFIAGNEPFTQGPVDYVKACRAAADKNITVSTIHCGSMATGVATKWEHGAKLADGSYMSIDHNAVATGIAAPQDKRIAELNATLNKTYVPYGDINKREASAARQAAQDRNALKSATGALPSRIQFKSSKNYINASWDLVDAVKDGKVKLADLKKDELPAEMQKLTADQQIQYIVEKTRKRVVIQKEILKLSGARSKYIATERMKIATPQASMLNSVMAEAVKKQVSRKNKGGR